MASWSHDLCLELIDEYRQHELLWNIQDQYYFDIHAKEEAWAKIAEKFQVEIEEVKRKIETLRGAYRREKSRLRNRRMTGKGRRSNWYAYNNMQFLDLNHDSSTKADIYESPSGNIETIKTKSNSMENMKIISEATESSSSIRFDISDEFSIFGLHVTNKLKKYSHVTRAYVEHEINNILFKADLGEFEEILGMDTAPISIKQLRESSSSSSEEIDCKPIIS